MIDFLGASAVLPLLTVAFALALIYCLSRCSKSMGRYFASRAFAREGGLPGDFVAVGSKRALTVSRFLRVGLLALTVGLSFLRGFSFRAALVLVSGFMCACSIESDVVYRYIPKELSTALLLSGGALQCSNVPSFVCGCLSGALLMFASCAVNEVARKHGGRVFAGGGDIWMMLSLSVSTGFGCVVGCFACCSAALLWSLIAKRSDRAFPMAPFFALWFLVGLTDSSF